MAGQVSAQQISVQHTHILYDPELVESPQPELFDSGWLQQQGRVTPVAGGRGDAWLVDHGQQHWVLRHYLRGGLVARFNRRLYLGWRLGATRAWREWHLLHRLWQLQLPVARPVAARVSWPWGRLSGLYQASILVERIAGARTLAQRLQQQALPADLWRRVGDCIARFHGHNVYHADLNANNILFDEHDRVYLIDFDRGAIKNPAAWKQANLQRLQRSLLKLQGLHGIFHFGPDDWRDLLAAYAAASSSSNGP
jgi:3-deoxy-D-manno-octulosonic acid kinase